MRDKLFTPYMWPFSLICLHSLGCFVLTGNLIFALYAVLASACIKRASLPAPLTAWRAGDE